eukprot:1071776-Pyramimonas_sp.AAC.1
MMTERQPKGSTTGYGNNAHYGVAVDVDVLRRFRISRALSSSESSRLELLHDLLISMEPLTPTATLAAMPAVPAADIAGGPASVSGTPAAEKS